MLYVGVHDYKALTTDRYIRTWKKALVASKCSQRDGSSSTTYLATSFDEYLDKLEKPTSLSWRTCKLPPNNKNMHY